MALRYALFATLFCLFPAADAADLDAFPASLDGKPRQVIRLPKVANEGRFMVELVPGRVELVDCNLRSYSARLQRKTVAGWGYSYYVLSDLQLGPTTLKACPPDSRKVRRFVRVRGDELMLPYNSRLPLVVYVPEGVELKYRVWRADKTLSEARTE
ncbi:ecotin [Microbulbifer donghaiensis]|uniref:Ecotin n=1 Tax=Microbulbifer donghaiensis TaxID=494016 RepID=A0A1M5AYU6_9GAMM|nr:ecotin family protein [Microbulbifer donghaiensis]SHF35461.1 ecotin [Microbulbifer donghaiensis]